MPLAPYVAKLWKNRRDPTHNALVDPELDAAEMNRIDNGLAAVTTELIAHEVDTTAVHGITDTTALETVAGSQAKADAVLMSADFRRMEEYWQAVYGDVTFSARGVINLRFDDGYATDYTTIFPELNSRHLPATFGVVSDFINASGQYITTAQALEMQQAGMEMACHSKTHGADPANLAAFSAETVTAQAALRALKLQGDVFIAPGTWVAAYLLNTAAKMDGTPAGQLLRANFAAAEAYVADDQVPAVPSLRPLPTARIYGGGGKQIEDLTVLQVQGVVDAAITYGGAFTLYMHSSQLGLPGKLTLANLQTILDYIKAKRDLGDIEMMSMGGMHRAKFGTPRNLFGDGNFARSTTATPFIWLVQGTLSTIDAGAGVAGTNALKSNQSGYLWQHVPALNIRSVRLRASVKNATAGQAATARAIVWQYDGAGAQLGGTYSRTFVCSDAYQSFETFFGVRPDAAYIYIGLLSNSANYVHWSNTELKKV